MRLFPSFFRQQPPPAATPPGSEEAAAKPKQAKGASLKTTTDTQTPTPAVNLAATDKVELHGSEPPAAKSKQAPAPPKTPKPLFEPLQDLLDFFKKLYQKFMDIFTPTSKEAIEKSLSKAASKARKYTNRIFLQQALQSPEKGPPELQASLEALTPTEQAFIVQDGQKAKKKLDALTPKMEKLHAKYEKLVNTSQSSPAAAEEAVSTKAAEGSMPAAPKSKTAATNDDEGSETFDNPLEEVVESLTEQVKKILNNEQVNEFLNKLKQESPELSEFLQKLGKDPSSVTQS
jgi:molecular chaperone GrpE (heat shock protein)